MSKSEQKVLKDACQGPVKYKIRLFGCLQKFDKFEKYSLGKGVQR